MWNNKWSLKLELEINLSPEEVRHHAAKSGQSHSLCKRLHLIIDTPPLLHNHNSGCFHQWKWFYEISRGRVAILSATIK